MIDLSHLAGIQSIDADGPWWSGACIYEVYLPSFLDTDGDGYGDLEGVRSKLPYLQWLGVDAIWITPFYPSPMRDSGYDISDYCAVAPRFGNLAQFESLVLEAHRLRIRVLVDLVVNHTSLDHPWFEAARADRASQKRDYYIWRDPGPGGSRPNNWISHFGGPAWTLDVATNQYWLHLFLPEQPDLNWDNACVADEVDQIIGFWVNKGVDGFRIDVAHGLVKDGLFRDNPSIPNDELPAGVREFHTQLHEFDHDRPEVLDVYRRWNRVVEGADALLVGEVNLSDAEKVARYSRDGDGLHLAMWFGLIESRWDVDGILKSIRAPVPFTPNIGWALSSHDRMRAVSRFGGGDTGRLRALAVGTLISGLQSALVVYQGDELGLEDGVISPGMGRDCVAAGGQASRDGARTPIPWNTEDNNGFSTGVPWLPLGGRLPMDTVQWQIARLDSTLHLWRNLLYTRRLLHRLPAPEWQDSPVGTLSYRRGGCLILGNLNSQAESFKLPPDRWEILYCSNPSGVELGDGSVRLLGESACVLCSDLRL